MECSQAAGSVRVHLLLWPDGPNKSQRTTKPPNGCTKAYAFSSSGAFVARRAYGSAARRTGRSKQSRVVLTPRLTSRMLWFGTWSDRHRTAAGEEAHEGNRGTWCATHLV